MVLIECGVFGDLGTGMHGDDSDVRGVFLFFFCTSNIRIFEPRATQTAEPCYNSCSSFFAASRAYALDIEYACIRPWQATGSTSVGNLLFSSLLPSAQKMVW